MSCMCMNGSWKCQPSANAFPRSHIRTLNADALVIRMPANFLFIVLCILFAGRIHWGGRTSTQTHSRNYMTMTAMTLNHLWATEFDTAWEQTGAVASIVVAAWTDFRFNSKRPTPISAKSFSILGHWGSHQNIPLSKQNLIFSLLFFSFHLQSICLPSLIPFRFRSFSRFLILHKANCCSPLASWSWLTGSKTCHAIGTNNGFIGRGGILSEHVHLLALCFKAYSFPRTKYDVRLTAWRMPLSLYLRRSTPKNLDMCVHKRFLPYPLCSKINDYLINYLRNNFLLFWSNEQTRKCVFRCVCV